MSSCRARNSDNIFFRMRDGTGGSASTANAASSSNRYSLFSNGRHHQHTRIRSFKNNHALMPSVAPCFWWLPCRQFALGSASPSPSTSAARSPRLSARGRPGLLPWLVRWILSLFFLLAAFSAVSFYLLEWRWQQQQQKQQQQQRQTAPSSSRLRNHDTRVGKTNPRGLPPLIGNLMDMPLSFSSQSSPSASSSSSSMSGVSAGGWKFSAPSLSLSSSSTSFSLLSWSMISALASWKQVHQQQQEQQEQRGDAPLTQRNDPAGRFPENRQQQQQREMQFAISPWVDQIPMDPSNKTKHMRLKQITKARWSEPHRQHLLHSATNESNKVAPPAAAAQVGLGPRERGGTALALLYPPGLLGGYRNQFLRFVSFVVQAKERHAVTLFLPSLLWQTQLSFDGEGIAKAGIGNSVRWYPIPMEWIFDIDYWNDNYAVTKHLPRLSNDTGRNHRSSNNNSNNTNDLDLNSDHRWDHGSGVASTLTDCWVDGWDESMVDEGEARLVAMLHRKYDVLMVNQTTAPMVGDMNYLNPLQRAALKRGRFLPISNWTLTAIDPQLAWLQGADITVQKKEMEGDENDNRTTTSQQAGADGSIMTAAAPEFNPRTTDLLPYVEHCQYPQVYGGGTKAGRLWNSYIKFAQQQQQQQQQDQKSSSSSARLSVIDPRLTAANQGVSATSVVRLQSLVPYQTDVWMYRALQPAPQWRQVAEQCIRRHTRGGNDGPAHRDDDGDAAAVAAAVEEVSINSQPYMALHARVELEIMAHTCGSDMEWNLTKIFHRLQEYFGLVPHDGINGTARNRIIPNRQTTASLTNPRQLGYSSASPLNVSGIFVAVSRAGMEEQGRLYDRFRAYADQNLATLNQLTGYQNDHDSTNLSLSWQRPLLGLGSSLMPVFECGDGILQEFYHNHPEVPDHGSLLQSVINFYLATKADVFVGVAGSSYSTDVMTARYYLGRGDRNYRYTRYGIEKVENGGLPKPHTNCKRPTSNKKTPT